MPNQTISTVGLGTLGSHIAIRLAKQQVNLKLIDFDCVEGKNLSTQNYQKADIGMPKVLAMLNHLKSSNPKLSIQSFPEKLTPQNLQLLNADLVIDCTDNLTTRYLINDSCYGKTPWFHTAALQDTASFYAILPGKPCFRCIYPKNVDGESCIQRGISARAAKMLATFATKQAIAILNNHQPEQSFIRINVESKTQDKIKVSRRCPKCRQFL